jgi:hypothetical protein
MKGVYCRELASDRRRISGTRFKLVNLVTNLFAGYLRVSLEWAPILQPVRLGPPAAPLPTEDEAGSTKQERAPLDEAHLQSNEAVIEVSVLSAAVQVRLAALCSHIINEFWMGFTLSVIWSLAHVPGCSVPKCCMLLA